LRVEQAAALLAISPRHLRDLCSRGQIRVVRLGKCVRIPRSEIARLCGDDVEAAPARDVVA
jgi:excisionase family DNA binding protein